MRIYVLKYIIYFKNLLFPPSFATFSINFVNSIGYNTAFPFNYRMLPPDWKRNNQGGKIYKTLRATKSAQTKGALLCCTCLCGKPEIIKKRC